ncbi:hypothetical protein HK102_000155 [Quaeritorhiza haematococci]|nr:hypothetical protein HK102_000155 [Quaeritorhiza haematococci]
MINRNPGMVGFVGGVCTDPTKFMQPILTYTKKPLITWSVGSPDLGDKRSYPFLLRTVPSDINQFKAILDMCVYYDWKELALIHDDSDFGMVSARSFKDEATKRKILISQTEIIPRTTRDSTTPMASLARIMDRNLYVVVSLLGGNVAHFVGKSAWRVGMRGWPYMCDTPIAKSYISYILQHRTLNFTANPTHPISKSLLEYSGGLSAFPDILKFDSGVHAYDAVISFAYAIANMVSSSTSSVSNGTALLQNLQQVRFDGVSGKVEYDANGERVTGVDMDVMNLDLKGNFSVVGKWNAVGGYKLANGTQGVQWPAGLDVTRIPTDGQVWNNIYRHKSYGGDDCSLVQPLSINTTIMFIQSIQCGGVPYFYAITPSVEGQRISINITVFSSDYSILRTNITNSRTNETILPDPTQPELNYWKYSMVASNDSAGTMDTFVLRVEGSETPTTTGSKTTTACEKIEYEISVRINNPTYRIYPLYAIQMRRKIFTSSNVDVLLWILTGAFVGLMAPATAPFLPPTVTCYVYPWTDNLAFWMNFPIWIKDNTWKMGLTLFLACVYLALWTVFDTEVHIMVVEGDTVFDMCTTTSWQIVIMSLQCGFLLMSAVLSFKVRRIPAAFNEHRLIAIGTFDAITLKIFSLLLQSTSNARSNLVIQTIGTNLDLFLSYLVTTTLIFGPKVFSIYIKRHPDDESTAASKSQSAASKKETITENVVIASSVDYPDDLEKRANLNNGGVTGGAPMLVRRVSSMHMSNQRETQSPHLPQLLQHQQSYHQSTPELEPRKSVVATSPKGTGGVMHVGSANSFVFSPPRLNKRISSPNDGVGKSIAERYMEKMERHDKQKSSTTITETPAGSKPSVANTPAGSKPNVANTPAVSKPNVANSPEIQHSYYQSTPELEPRESVIGTLPNNTGIHAQNANSIVFSPPRLNRRLSSPSNAVGRSISQRSMERTERQEKHKSSTTITETPAGSRPNVTNSPAGSQPSFSSNELVHTASIQRRSSQRVMNNKPYSGQP